VDPKEILNNPEQIKNLISLLQSLLPSDTPQNKKPKKPRANKKNTETIETENETLEETTPQVFLNNNIKTRNKRQLKPVSFNNFEKMNEFKMHKDDRNIDKKLAKHPPVARTRDFEPMQVTCRICGKKEIVSPSLVYEGAARYKCNNCSTQAG
jgi:hypothetical protein